MGYRWNQPAYSLSYANRRRLEIARALALTPSILLLDEPAAGMNPAETHEITELIAKIRIGPKKAARRSSSSSTTCTSSRESPIALSRSDHGIKLAEGHSTEVATDERVVEAYLGLRTTERSKWRCSTRRRRHLHGRSTSSRI